MGAVNSTESSIRSYVGRLPHQLRDHPRVAQATRGILLIGWLTSFFLRLPIGTTCLVSDVNWNGRSGVKTFNLHRQRWMNLQVREVAFPEASCGRSQHIVSMPRSTLRLQSGTRGLTGRRATSITNPVILAATMSFCRSDFNVPAFPVADFLGQDESIVAPSFGGIVRLHEPLR